MPIRFVVAIVLVLVGGYGVLKAWPLLAGPEIRLSSPLTDTHSPDGFITISGTALHTQSLSLDGGPLLIDSNGAFSERVLLPAGGVILTLTATDRFGRTALRKANVLVD